MTGEDSASDGQGSASDGQGSGPRERDSAPAEQGVAPDEGGSTPAARALERTNGVERRAGGTFAVTTTVFDAVVAVVEGEDPARYRVTVGAPTLDAAVAGSVADVVATDWYETFALRVADLPRGVARSVADGPDVATADGEVVVEAELSATDPDRAAADAKAVVEFVEGTWVQGVVPGYEYEEPVAGLLSRARRRARGGGP